MRGDLRECGILVCGGKGGALAAGGRVGGVFRLAQSSSSRRGYAKEWSKKKIYEPVSWHLYVLCGLVEG
jgi:hypothetical protein